jgi:hypothetical protein
MGLSDVFIQQVVTSSGASTMLAVVHDSVHDLIAENQV